MFLLSLHSTKASLSPPIAVNDMFIKILNPVTLSQFSKVCQPNIGKTKITFVLLPFRHGVGGGEVFTASMKLVPLHKSIPFHLSSFCGCI